MSDQNLSTRVILCDYEKTLDRSSTLETLTAMFGEDSLFVRQRDIEDDDTGSEPLLQALKEIKTVYNTRIFLATDVKKFSAESSLRKLQAKGYDIFENVIDADSLGTSKKNPHYIHAITKAFGLNKEDVIYIDDCAEYLESAKEYGVMTINADNKDMNVVAAEVKNLFGLK